MFFNHRVPIWIRRTYYYDSIGGLLYGVFYGLTLYFILVIARKTGANDAQMAFLTSAPFICSLFSFYWAHLSETRKKMSFLVLVRSIGRAVFLLSLLAPKGWLYALMVLLFWLFEYMGFPAYIGIVREVYPERYRGRALGYVRVEMASVAILAAYAGGHLLDEIGYRYVFPLGALFGLTSLYFFKRIKVESDNRITNKRPFSLKNLVMVFKNDRGFFRYSLIFFLFGFGNLLASPLYPIFLVDELNVSSSLVGKLGALYSLVWMMFYFIWGECIDRHGSLRTLIIIIFMVAFIPLSYGLAQNIWPIVVATLISGAVWAGTELCRISYITSVSSEATVQTYWGIDYTLMGIRGIIAPFLGVKLMGLIGIRQVFALSSLVIFISFLLMKHYKRTLQSDK